jgi:uncharacterized protein
MADLKPGMVLEGVVTNVAAFGAFVDVGVHQDGLVHVSALSNTYVKDPRDVVKSGDVVKVRVVDVDEPRKRISLTMRLTDEPRPSRERTRDDRPRPQQGGPQQGGPQQGGPQQGRPEQGRQQQGRQQQGRPQQGRHQGPQQQGRQRPQEQGSFGGGAMADALRRAGLAGD